jgi:hypothetical protein
MKPLIVSAFAVLVGACGGAPKSSADAHDVKPKECDFPHDAARETHYHYDPLRKDVSLYGPLGSGASELPPMPGPEWRQGQEGSAEATNTDGHELDRLVPCH